jgi:DNA-binding SARP family transcriptional activator
VEFRVLGPIELYGDRGAVRLRAGLERSLLALLLLNAGRVVTRERIVDALWADPPASARAQVHNAVSRLRRRAALGELLSSHGSGYRLDLGENAFDLAEFRRLVAAARGAGSAQEAVELLGTALGRWRGPALADAVEPLVEAVRPGLEGERLRAAEALLDAELAAGRPDAVLDAVGGLLAEHPHHEDLHRRQILALSALGRRADALDAYQRARERLVTDLGIEPGAALRGLHQRILDGAPLRSLPASAGPASTGPASAGPEPAAPAPPRQLPAAEEALSGRAELVAAVRAALRRGRLAPSVVVLTGPGGAGKSALAVHAAQLQAADFPDGQLYADLRGAHGVPVDPHEVIGRFLRGLGMPAGEVAPDRDERVVQYRSALAGRRVLVMMDDARDEPQVRPLLPGAAGCAVVITSRRRLDALPLAVTYDVPTLDPASAILLLARAAGRSVGEGAADVVALCGHLPLAIRIAGARLAARPDWTAAALHERLLGARLDELVVGDLDVRASIALSYRSLPPEVALTFRRLGLPDASSFPAWLPAVLAGEPPERGQGLLLRLLDHHLVQAAEVDQAGQPRYRLHDLVHEFAREAALADDPQAERDAALRRAAQGWLALAAQADQRIGHGAEPAPAVGTAGTPTPAARERPLDWFEAERSNVLAAVRTAVELGHHELASDLALCSKGFWTMRGYGLDNEVAQRLLVEHLRAEDPAEHGERLLRHLRALFWACAEQDRNEDLPGICAEMVTVTKALGDEPAQLDAEWQLGQVAGRLGNLRQAVEIHRGCLAGALRLGRTEQHVLHAHVGLALALADLGDAAAAVEEYRRALLLPGATGRKEAILRSSYAEALIEAGELGEAERALERAAEVVAATGDVVGAAHVRIVHARLDIARGRWAPATARLSEALDVVRAHRERHGTGRALLALGEASIGLGQPLAAIRHLDEALDVARRSSRPVDVARVHARLAVAWRLSGDPDRASQCGEACRHILDELDVPAACLRMPPHLAGAGAPSTARCQGAVST